MEVYVRTFATLVEKMKRLFEDEHREIRAGTTLKLEMPGESLITDLLNRLQIEKKEASVVFVNGMKRDYQYRLSPGDHVGIFPPLGGG